MSYYRLTGGQQPQAVLVLSGVEAPILIQEWTFDKEVLRWTTLEGRKAQAPLSAIITFTDTQGTKRSRYEVIQNIYANAEPSNWWDLEVRITWSAHKKEPADWHSGMITGWDPAEAHLGDTEVWFERYDGKFYTIPLDNIQEITKAFSRESIYVNFIRDMQRKPWEEYDPERTSRKTTEPPRRVNDNDYWHIASLSGNTFEVNKFTLTRDAQIRETSGNEVAVGNIEYAISPDGRTLSREDFIKEVFATLCFPHSKQEQEIWLIESHINRGVGDIKAKPCEIRVSEEPGHILVEGMDVAVVDIAGAHVWGSPNLQLFPHLIRYLQRKGIITSQTPENLDRGNEERETPKKKGAAVYKVKSEEVSDPDKWFPIDSVELDEQGSLLLPNGNAVTVGSLTAIKKGRKTLSKMQFIEEAFPDAAPLPEYFWKDLECDVWFSSKESGFTRYSLGELWETDPEDVTAVEAPSSLERELGYPSNYDFYIPWVRHIQRTGGRRSTPKQEPAKKKSPAPPPEKKEDAGYEVYSSLTSRWYPVTGVEKIKNDWFLQTSEIPIPLYTVEAVRGETGTPCSKVEFIQEFIPREELPAYFFLDLTQPIWYATKNYGLHRSTLEELWEEDLAQVTRVEMTGHVAEEYGYESSADFYAAMVHHKNKAPATKYTFVKKSSCWGPTPPRLVATAPVKRDADGWLLDDRGESFQLALMEDILRNEEKVSIADFIEEAFPDASLEKAKPARLVWVEWADRETTGEAALISSLKGYKLEDILSLEGPLAGGGSNDYDFYIEWVRDRQREAAQSSSNKSRDVPKEGTMAKLTAQDIRLPDSEFLQINRYTGFHSTAAGIAYFGITPPDNVRPVRSAPVTNDINNNDEKKKTKETSSMFANLTNMFKIGAAEDLGLNVKVTMSGQVAVYDESSASYVVPSSFGKKLKLEQVMEDFTMDIPAMVMPCPLHELKENDLVLDGKGISLVLGVTDNTIDALSVERKTKTTIVPMSHQFMGAQNFVSKLVPFNMLAGGGGMNPMMLMLLMGKMGKKDGKDNKGFDMNQMLPFLMMSGGMGSAGGATNPFGSLFGGGAVGVAPNATAPVAGLPADFDVNPVLRKLADYGGTVVVHIKDPFDEVTAVTGRVRYTSGVDFTIVVPTGGEVKAAIADVDHVASAANPAKTLKLV